MRKEYDIRNNLHEAIRLEEDMRPPMPADLNARLARRLEEETDSNHKPKRLYRLLPWIAAACAAACFTIPLVPLNNGKTNDSPVANKWAEKKLEKQAEVTGKTAFEPLLSAANTPAPKPKGETRTAEKPCLQETVCKDMREERETEDKTRTQDILTTECQESVECDLSAVAEKPATTADTQKPRILTERDIPVTRPENLKYTKEEIALLQKQANEAYIKWMELELEIAKYQLEQTANNIR